MIRSAAYMIGSLVVTAIVHLYLHRRLVLDSRLPAPWHARARTIAFALASLFPMGMGALLSMHDLPRSIATPLMACVFGWMGLVAFGLPVLLAGEPIRALPLKSPARRQAMSRAVAMVTGAAAVGLGGTSAVIAQRAPIVRHVRVAIRGWKKPYTLVQISDLHVSALIGRPLVEDIVARVNALSPDLVAITGDLVDGSVRALGPLVAPLGDLRSRDGVFFVTGNHEYLSGVDEWLAHLPSLGIRILRNARVAIGDFDLVGIDDPDGSPDLEAAMRDRDKGRPSILLAHRPDDVHAAVAHDIDLQISGHTHGGQIPPWWVLERVHQPYVFGLYEIGRTLLYVTSGAGYWGPPMRLGARAEIVVFEITAA